MEGVRPYASRDAAVYRANGWWSDLVVSDLLDKASQTHPGAEAVVWRERRLTYQELLAEVESFARGLLSIGLTRGSAVMIQLPNCTDFVVAFYAVQKIGAVPLVLVPKHGAREVGYLCRAANAKAWILPPQHGSVEQMPIVDEVRRTNPQLTEIIISGAPAPSGMHSVSHLTARGRGSEWSGYDLENQRPAPSEVCLLLPTGGTTGFPKLVPRTHESYVSNISTLANAWELNDRDRCLLMTPVGHNLALLVGVTGGVFAGATVVLGESPAPEQFFQLVETERVTCTALVPALVTRYLNFEQAGQYDRSTLRMVYAGGQHSPSHVVRQVKTKFGSQYVNGFGMSEGPITQTRLSDPDEVIESTVGAPCCAYDEFVALDADGAQLGVGREGELAVKGPGVFSGYLNADNENSKAFTRDGYFRTGDLGRIDGQGRITITGRIKDIIIRGGENISATEVEEVLLQYPGIVQAAAIGMPDEELGERVCAFVRLGDCQPVELETVVEYLKTAQISPLLLPERIEIVASFPMTKAEKVDKKVLRDWIKSNTATAD